MTHQPSTGGPAVYMCTLDHVIIFGEGHLRCMLWAYADYYDGTRTHLSLSKDAPLGREIQRRGQIQFVGHLRRPAPFFGPDLIIGRDSLIALRSLAMDAQALENDRDECTVTVFPDVKSDRL